MTTITVPRAVVEQALDFIVATNKSSQFWMVPESNLNKTVTALRAALEQQAYTDDLNQRIKLYVGSRLGPPQPAEPFTPDAIRTTQTAWKMGYDAAKAETQPAEPQTTHSSECWRWHHKCAVAKIERECKHD